MNIPCMEAQTALVFSTRLEDVLNCVIALVRLPAEGDHSLAPGIAPPLRGEKGLHSLPPKS